jgi:predicted site-specific integrase-resolvase
MVSRETLREWIYVGKITGQVIYAGKYWVPEAEIRRLMSALEPTP